MGQAMTLRKSSTSLKGVGRTDPTLKSCRALPDSLIPHDHMVSQFLEKPYSLGSQQDK